MIDGEDPAAHKGVAPFGHGFAARLDAWMPRLVAAWRLLRGRPDGAAPALTLSLDERRDLHAGVAQLNAGLTRERGLAGERYFEDARLLGAYLLLYWPVSYAQAASVLGELGCAPGAILDVGAGPAPLALAALDAGGARATAIDRSRAALGVGEALARAAGLALGTALWDPSQAPPAGPFDTILVGHLLNELDPRVRATLCEALLDRLRPGGHLILLEPALRETSRALLSVRDSLVARGATLLSPCLWRGDCPALARTTDWCHAERALFAPPLVQELAAEARLHREALKMTYLVFQSRAAAWPEPPSGRVFRIVSEPLDEKGKRRRIGCGPEGRLPLVLPEKHVDDPNRVFLELERGDLVRVAEAEVRGDGLRLPRGASVERLARAGEPLPRSQK